MNKNCSKCGSRQLIVNVVDGLAPNKEMRRLVLENGWKVAVKCEHCGNTVQGNRKEKLHEAIDDAWSVWNGRRKYKLHKLESLTNIIREYLYGKTKKEA